MDKTIELFNMINELVNDNSIYHEIDYKQIDDGQYLAINFEHIFEILKKKHQNRLILKFSCSSIKKAISKEDYCISSSKVVKMRDIKTLKLKAQRVLVIDIHALEKRGTNLSNLYLK